MGYQILQARLDKGVPIPGPPGADGQPGPPGPQGPPGTAAAAGPLTSIQVNNNGQLIGYSGLAYDGLVLKGGAVQFACTNPEVGNDPNDRRAWELVVTSDNLNCNPTFSDANGFQLQQIIRGGYYNYDNTIQAKSTTLPLSVSLIGQGASQAFGIAVNIQKDSMGDCGAWNGYVSYRGGPLVGDEGQCFQCVTYHVQDSMIVTRTITSVTRSGCPANMTVTQAVTASKDPQTINVSGTSGLAVNDWLVAGQSTDTCVQHIRALQVISFTATTITAVVAVNLASGDSLKPALVLTLQFGNGKFGQLIPIVNLSGATYSTGTVSSIAGGGFNGTGTAWAENMVGGDALNIGAVSLVADNDSDTPFNTTPPETPGGAMLRSWYQILNVTAAQLAINAFSVAGDRSYRGKGPGSGQYLVKPAARALWFPDGGTVVCEYSAHTWNVGDVVESIIVPYPDVSLQLWNMAAYTPGGTYRGGIFIGNGGHRTFNTGITITGQTMTGGDRPWGWGTGLLLEQCRNGIQIGDTINLAIGIYQADPSHNCNIEWSGVGEGAIGSYGNVWDPGRITIDSGAGSASHLDFCSGAVTGDFPEMRWGGNITVIPPNNADNVFFQIAVDEGPVGSDPTQYRLDYPLKGEFVPHAAGTHMLRAFRMEAALNHADGNLYFHYIDDYNGISAKTFGITTGASGPGPWLGTLVAKRGTATATVNYGSYEAMFETSIWHAGAAQQQYLMLRAEPESMAPDAHNTFSIYIWSTAGGNSYQPNRPFAVNDVGKLSIGNPSPFVGGGFTATFDPTGVTANRTLALPDASGRMLLINGTQFPNALVTNSAADLVQTPSATATLTSPGGADKLSLANNDGSTRSAVLMDLSNPQGNAVMNFPYGAAFALGYDGLAIQIPSVGTILANANGVTFPAAIFQMNTPGDAEIFSGAGAGHTFTFRSPGSIIFRVYSALTSTYEPMMSVTGAGLTLQGYTLTANNFADDTAAAAGGVPIGGVYHNAGALRVRLT